jgi:hypothetical protein
VQAKTTLGAVFTTWKKINDGTDVQLMALLGATPRQYREMANEILKPDTAAMTGDHASARPGPNPSSAAIKAIANRHGISAVGLTDVIKSI